MELPDDGLVLVVKKDCPTCRLIEPVAQELAARGLLSTLLSQDEPDFPADVTVTDDRALEGSFRLDVTIVPTLIRRRGGAEVARVFGWHRDEWQHITGINDLGGELPDQRPGCGSLSVNPGMPEELLVRFGDTGLTARTIEVAYPDDQMEQLFERGWSDGLPVVPPTPARVLRMLQGTRRAAHEVVANIPPAMASCSVEKVAINAVLAGCKPDYLPVVLACVDAASDPAYAWNGVLSTTMGVGPVVVVNGPIAKRLGMNSGFNVLGFGNRANATIARALQLIARNVGGAVPGGVDRSTFGHRGKFGLCFAEIESDESWQPLSVSRGYAATTSTVTLFSGCGSHLIVDESSRKPAALCQSIADNMTNVGHVNHRQVYGVMLVLGPEHWAVFKDAGWDRARVQKGIITAGVHRKGTGASLEPDENQRVTKFRHEDLLMVLAGSQAGLMSTVIPGWISGDRGSIPITREVVI